MDEEYRHAEEVKLRGREKVSWLFTFVAAVYNLYRLQRLQAQAATRASQEAAMRHTKSSLRTASDYAAGLSLPSL